MQGSAVRTWTHTPIYHTAVRMHHFAPVAAILLEQIDWLKNYSDDALRPVVRNVDNFFKYVDKKYKQLTK